LAVLGEDSGPEVFSFDGGDVRIKVRSNGRCEARFSDGAVSVDVKLTPDDLETFERLAGEARLREDPPPHVPSREEFGWGPERFGWWLRLDGTECWISMGERTADVARWLRRLTTEACFLRIVQDPESSFFLPDPENLLHPRVRKGSLERALAVWESPATIVDALARVASCEEWTRAVEERLRYRDEESVDSLAMALASCDELPTEHRDARARLLLEVFLREYAASDLDRTRRRAARSVADVLCHARCRPAIPIIIRMIERADEEVYDLAFEEYGVAAMDPLAKLLSSPNPFARRYAVRCVRSLADGIGGHADVLPRLRVEFTLKIREIARHDPDGTAQTLAGRTLPVIACAVFGG